MLCPHPIASNLNYDHDNDNDHEHDHDYHNRQQPQPHTPCRANVPENTQQGPTKPRDRPTTHPSRHVATHHAAHRAEPSLTTTTTTQAILPRARGRWGGQGQYAGSQTTRHRHSLIVKVHAALSEHSSVPRHRLRALARRQPIPVKRANWNLQQNIGTNSYLARGQPQPQPPLHPQRNQDHNARQQASQQTGTILQMRRKGNTADHTNRPQQQQTLQRRTRRQQDAE